MNRNYFNSHISLAENSTNRIMASRVSVPEATSSHAQLVMWQYTWYMSLYLIIISWSIKLVKINWIMYILIFTDWFRIKKKLAHDLFSSCLAIKDIEYHVWGFFLLSCHLWHFIGQLFNSVWYKNTFKKTLIFLRIGELKLKDRSDEKKWRTFQQIY